MAKMIAAAIVHALAPLKRCVPILRFFGCPNAGVNESLLLDGDLRRNFDGLSSQAFASLISPPRRRRLAGFPLSSIFCKLTEG
jgi:hypothetical protein